MFPNTFHQQLYMGAPAGYPNLSMLQMRYPWQQQSPGYFQDQPAPPVPMGGGRNPLINPPAGPVQGGGQHPWTKTPHPLINPPAGPRPNNPFTNQIHPKLPRQFRKPRPNPLMF
jgi:hypothetical protein